MGRQSRKKKTQRTRQKSTHRVQTSELLLNYLSGLAMECQSDLAPCNDCGKRTLLMGEYYMVNDSVWEATNGGSGFLCIGCLETRINRELTPDDFKDVPLNNIEEYGDIMSKKLRSRIMRKVA